ncbi:two-component sensor histidine kinase [Mycetocola zhadangensis]|uniref:histidine kinase n=1 Tax=Mycetocola zhadangensis TaxID=1164595 RepID=A0A3L7J1X5_9MICO|nr:histidine kinase [Mycetocola zhadangensis]RLQ84566.1 two-component sensor histidine kinase [Mycetocola zhadangensis]GGE91835.1 two-component sensor histidine kinase [Mycetocola zhadangensis]
MRTADILIASIYAFPEAVARIVTYVDGSLSPVLNTFALLLGAVTTVALYKRRSAPMTALIITLAVTALFIWNSSSMGPIALTIALYSVAVHHSVRAAWIGLGATAVAVALAGLATAGIATDPADADVISTIIGGLFAVLIGINIGNRKRYIGALVDRAGQLARERDQQAQLAAASERSRIAREMHDIVAHSLSVMIRLADGAEAMVEKDPDASLAAIRNVGSTGRASLAEMRRLLGILRDEENEIAERAPQPTLDELPQLVESYRATGLPATLTVTGVPPVGQGAQVTIYRAVQEALTNALRYASQPSRVDVVLECADGAVTVTVTDDGKAGETPVSEGTGRGLVGMAERAALYGGTVTSGPMSGGGWRVHMTMPETGENP